MAPSQTLSLFSDEWIPMAYVASLTWLAALWLAFFVSHSWLAGDRLERRFGSRSRLVFNAIAVVMLALPMGMLAHLPAQLLWQQPSGLRWALDALGLLAVAGFVHTLKYYSLAGFIGLRIETWPLTFSPWHCWVRHPWYFLMLVMMWSRPLTDTWLLAAISMSLYLVIGSRIEERRLLRLHPGSYGDYCQRVPGLLPWRGRALDETTRLALEARALTESTNTAP